MGSSAFEKKSPPVVEVYIGLTDRQGVLTPSMYPISPLVYPEVRVFPIVNFVFFMRVMRLISILNLHIFITYLIIYRLSCVSIKMVHINDLKYFSSTNSDPQLAVSQEHANTPSIFF